MVVPQNDLKEAFSDPDFRHYIDSIVTDKNHHLNEFCSNFNNENLIDSFQFMGSPIEATDNFRQLMAEWFRRKHANRAEQTVNTPWESAGISSPRTELIPKRLFRILGQICALHGANFKEIVGENVAKTILALAVSLRVLSRGVFNKDDLFTVKFQAMKLLTE